MELTMNRTATVRTRFDYVVSTFDNGVKYGVWQGGKAPLNCNTLSQKGTYIGQVAKFDKEAYPYRDEWFAAPTYGSQDADRLNWHGPFKSRKEASVFLTGLNHGYAGAVNFIAEG